MLLDSSGAIYQSYGVQGFPTEVFIDSNGNITHTGLGAMSEEAMWSEVQSLLGAASTTTSTTGGTTTTTGSTTTTSSTTSTTAAAPAFPDVPASSPYYTAISAMATERIVSGFADGSFGPDRPVLRKQFAKMIVGAMGLAVTEDDWQDANPPFTDCGPDDPGSLYPHDYIAVAKAHGLTAGKTASTFAPDANITRAQLVTMVVRAAQNSGLTLNPVGAGYAGTFEDYSDPTHGANVHLAEYNGLLQGLVVTGDASTWMAGNATRGEVAQLLWNLMLLRTNGNDVFGFEVVSETDSALQFRVSYRYLGDHGANVYIGVDANDPGLTNSYWWGYRPSAALTTGTGSALVTLTMIARKDAPDTPKNLTTKTVSVIMYEGGKVGFATRVFAHTKNWKPMAVDF